MAKRDEAKDYTAAKMEEHETARGVRALTGSEFDALESVGGVRGLIEAVLPGLIYLVVFVITQDLHIALIGSLAVAALMVVARLVQGTPVTMAFSGIFGVAIGLYVAWKSGDAKDFYVWGLLVNAGYLLGMLITVLVRWPGVGIIVEMLKSGFGAQPKNPSSGGEPAAPLKADTDSSVVRDETQAIAEVPSEETPVVIFPTEWRKNKVLLKAYTAVTWLWIAMFAARLVVQLPLYLVGDSTIAALGAARLIMGVPLFAFVLFLSWRIIRQATVVEVPRG